MEFEVLIDSKFLDIVDKTDLELAENKKVLSLINDYEDELWRYKKFHNFIWDNIKETALSAREREALVNQESTTLSSVAQNLRLTDKPQDIGKGSELAEILLYGIMKHYYNALPIVPKIFYKQNVNDNAKGADSVHIVLNESKDDFTLWFGEAKFYNSIADARLNEIIKSVENSLLTEKIRKENSIITSLGELDLLLEDPRLIEKIKLSLSNKNSIDTIKPKLHIPILLLHECEITSKNTALSDDYKSEIVEYHKERAISFFNKQIEKLSKTVSLYESIFFHIILFPVPDKAPIIEAFSNRAQVFKDM